ncbi:MAG: Carbamoyl-phosphate synthase chain ATP-binding protein, partial [Ramlibacter sp.]|nr:Carbamoyl-phosphate synthase chain ATP-binding protein [Ramlibacter sp.]
MFHKILIANRGEIACRIARTVRRMGLQAATIHSSADAAGLHVRDIGESVLVGDAPARSSYLDIAAVVAAARRVGADAVHPGFGFLSENPAFAQACRDAGIAFIGPSPEVLALFGDKAAAKELARQLDIPTAGGMAEPSEDVDALLAAVRELPLPCVLKAAAGGGGKGMRVVREAGEARAAIESAIREGRSAFGDGRLIVERYLSAPRHVEVQILGDGAGGVIHLHDRECTLQRRFQKVVEEAPVTSIPDAQRESLWTHALALGRATRYLGLGTVEFAVTADGAVFLEVNPRLQVEHPVTETVTGLDLVALQIETVATGRLPLAQAEVPRPRGVAVQARLYAEDPSQGFLP